MNGRDGRASVTLFAHLTGRPDASIDLAEAALLIGTTATPDLDVPDSIAKLDALGAGAKRAIELGKASDGMPAPLRVARYLFDVEGFSGNKDDYYDPRNSFLDQVIDRRTGIPISLAVVLIEVCRRAGVEARGVSFPGHFLVRAEVDGRRGTLVLDPFTGRPFTVEELRALYARGAGRPPPAELPPKVLEPATKTQILGRMLNNLRIIYEQRNDGARLCPVLELLHVVAPSAELEARIEALGGYVAGRTRETPSKLN